MIHSRDEKRGRKKRSVRSEMKAQTVMKAGNLCQYPDMPAQVERKTKMENVMVILLKAITIFYD